MAACPGPLQYSIKKRCSQKPPGVLASCFLLGSMLLNAVSLCLQISHNLAPEALIHPGGLSPLPCNPTQISSSFPAVFFPPGTERPKNKLVHLENAVFASPEDHVTSAGAGNELVCIIQSAPTHKDLTVPEKVAKKCPGSE